MLSSLWAWLRRHERFVDGVLAAGLLLLSLPFAIAGWPGGPDTLGGMPVRVLVLAGLCVPLVWRRQRPTLVFAFVALAAFAQWAVNWYPMVADAALFVGGYTVAARSRRREVLLALLTLEVGCALVAARWVSGSLFVRVAVFMLLSGAVLAWVLLGDSMRSRRAYYSELEARAARLEREREQEARLAVAAERARIAREMHDVVAHNVSVMVVQAEGASYLLDIDPERSRGALRTVATTGRQALAEMRRLLGVLRSERDGDGALAPQPGLGDLPDLVAGVVAAGLPVELEVSGDGAPVEPGPALAAYRLVQEALTNVLKHAGPGARAQVRLCREPGGLRLAVHDDGRGTAADPGDGSGHGLQGMRERLAVYGGTLRAGPRPGGGFEVAAVIPTGGG